MEASLFRNVNYDHVGLLNFIVRITGNMLTFYYLLMHDFMPP